MRKKIIQLVLVLTFVLSLTACGEKSKEHETNEYRTVILNEDENKQLLEDMLHFVENNGSGAELIMFSDDLVIRAEDIVTGAGVKDINYYVSSNAAYLQVGSNMYRFQFNRNNQVISYIKYEVEA